MSVLIVDDDEAIASMLSRFLSKEGFEVHTALDALQAIDFLERKQIGLVIADVMMPHMNGRELVRRIRKDPKTKDLPVILITAYPSDEVADGSLKDGASFFLPKPLDLDALATLIRFAQ
ncbi:MAG: response regulator [Deltaproteobacteria bacterium]